jgi:hypothetical protein
MKLLAVLALACGFTAAPLIGAGSAAAIPDTCDGADCVPYVDRNIVPTDPCVFASRHPFGMDATGNTFACNASNAWTPVAPLVGIRTLRAPCDEKVPGVAQSPNGQPLSCQGQAWTSYFDVLYYS